MHRQGRRTWTLAAIGGAIFGSGGLWTIVERAGDVDFLMGLSVKSPLVQWLASNAEYLLMGVGAVLLALNLWSRRWSEKISSLFAAWRHHWRMRHWTSEGLNWRVLPESHGTGRDGRMYAILSITPVPGSELPQPLDLLVACRGLIGELSTRFYFDQAKPEGESSGDVEIEQPEGKTARLTLLSPKFLPPVRLDVILHSQGNAEVKVEYVKRAPEKRGIP
jgi:hypothetical protein